MTIPANGTDAKDIALHFINLTTGRATPQMMKKTIVQAKSLLSSGYTKDEILDALEYVINIKGVEIYSLGYINASIENILREIQKLNKEQEIKKEKEKMVSESIAKRDEVSSDGKSTQRNRDKASRFGVQPRFGKEFNLDMFEGNG